MLGFFNYDFSFETLSSYNDEKLETLNNSTKKVLFGNLNYKNK